MMIEQLIEDQWELMLKDFGEAFDLQVVDQSLVPETFGVLQSKSSTQVRGIVTRREQSVEGGVRLWNPRVRVMVCRADLPSLSVGEVLCVVLEGLRYPVTSKLLRGPIMVLSCDEGAWRCD